ncbi:MAG: hypothetical protein IPH04_09195 [Saprospirales bacterium]|nr:hypothetical protein [Saprospirales bacterium]
MICKKQLFRILLALVILLPGFGRLSAQVEQTYTDIIFLKNGSVFKSRIIDYRQGDTITVEIAGGHILKFADADIAKIQQASVVPQEPQTIVRERRKAISRDAYPVKGGYGFATAAFSGQTGGVFGPSASIINFEGGGGYQFGRFLGLGIGTGYNLYDVNRGESVIPLYLDYRMYPFKKNLGPYLNLAGGYGFALKEEALGIVEAKGGILLHPSIGWRVAVGDKFFFTFDLGARFQKAEYTQENQWWLPGRTVREVTYQRTTFRIGIQIW